MRPAILLVAAVALAACDRGSDTQAAAKTGMNHGTMSNGASAPPGSPAAALDAAMATMHAGATPATADIDESFMRMMIPHHRAAIDMAQVVRRHGSDPEVRQLADEVIAAQGREIRQMEAWLAKRKTAAR